MSKELKEEFLESYRKQRSELTPVQRVICNAAIIAGITFLSTLSIGFPPTAQNLWAASIAAGLALLTQLKTLTNTSETLIEQKPKRPLGMLI